MRLLFFFLLTSISVSAQLKGSIADIENQPIPYVNIYLENSYTGTTSNEQGNYELALSVPGTYNVVFQFLGLISIFSSLNMLYVTLYFPSINQYKTRMKILISGGFFNLIIALILVQFFAIYGVAFSAVTTELFILILSMYYYYKKINKKVAYWKI